VRHSYTKRKTREPASAGVRRRVAGVCLLLEALCAGGCETGQGQHCGQGQSMEGFIHGLSFIERSGCIQGVESRAAKGSSRPSSGYGTGTLILLQALVTLESAALRAQNSSRLKPSTQTISLCLPETLLENLKMLANKRDVPYQSLLKIFLAERIEQSFAVCADSST
jgi:predicted DNA binding CopG/RHH family protein